MDKRESMIFTNTTPRNGTRNPSMGGPVPCEHAHVAGAVLPESNSPPVQPRPQFSCRSSDQRGLTQDLQAEVQGGQGSPIPGPRTHHRRRSPAPTPPFEHAQRRPPI